MLIGDAINLAIEHERAGRLAEAERICRAIVDQYPSTSAAWNLLAMIAARSGRDDLAVENLNRAIAGDPNIAALHANMGELKKRLGRPDEALAAFQKAAELEPESAIMHNKLGIALRFKGDFEASAAEFARAIALDPVYADPHNNRGNALRDLGRLDEAMEEYRVAIGLKPNLAEAHVNLGNVLGDQRQFDQALAEYQAALRIQPNHAETLSSVAGVLRQTKKFDEALAKCREAIRLKPGHAEGYNVLGSIFYDREEFDEAIAAFEKAIELDRASVMKRNNLAMAFGAAGKLEEAISIAKTAVEMKPDYAEGFNTLGNLLADLGRYDDAAAAFGRAIQLKPDHAIAHWNLSLILLQRGDFENGWAEHEWRRKTTVESHPREFAQPMWDGGDLHGRTILLHHEQGFGDMIQFVRYAPLVAERGGRVILSCPTELASLLREIPEIAEVHVGDDLPEFDCHCPMLSLPAVFKTRVESIPAKIPYLKAPIESVAQMAGNIGGKGRAASRRIGVGGQSPAQAGSAKISCFGTVDAASDGQRVSILQFAKGPDAADEHRLSGGAGADRSLRPASRFCRNGRGNRESGLGDFGGYGRGAPCRRDGEAGLGSYRVCASFALDAGSKRLAVVSDDASVPATSDG